MGVEKAYDIVDDEHKKMNLLEWQFELSDELVTFVRQMAESQANPCNEEQKVTEHTFNEWMGIFRRWASF